MGILQITGGKMTRRWFVPALWKMLRSFLKLSDQMCCHVYLDEHVCKDSLPGGAGVAIHLCLSWLTQLAAPFLPIAQIAQHCNHQLFDERQVHVSDC